MRIELRDGVVVDVWLVVVQGGSCRVYATGCWWPVQTLQLDPSDSDRLVRRWASSGAVVVQIEEVDNGPP